MTQPSYFYERSGVSRANTRHAGAMAPTRSNPTGQETSRRARYHRQIDLIALREPCIRQRQLRRPA